MKLCLGTAQLGLEYGIASKGKPRREDSLKILKKATELGINTFDTASAYGNSEQIIGEFIKMFGNSACINIISKPERNTNIINSVEETLLKVGKSQINGYLFHDAFSMYSLNQKRKMLELKQMGYVKNIGVSIYKEADAIFAVNQDWIDYIQIPYNVLDQRLNRTDFFKTAKLYGKTIFARSALLQGVLGLDEGKAYDKLKFAEKHIRAFNYIARKYGLGNAEMAIKYVKFNDDIDYLVFGVDSVEQLSAFVSVFEDKSIDVKVINEIKETFKQVEKRVIMPNLW